MKCKKLIFDALWKNGGRVVASAEQLGISKGFFWYLLRRHAMDKTPANIRVEFLKRYRALDR